MLCTALEKDVRSFSEGFHELPWHHGFPQRYFKLWNLSHDAVGARPDRQDAQRRSVSCGFAALPGEVVEVDADGRENQK